MPRDFLDSRLRGNDEHFTRIISNVMHYTMTSEAKLENFERDMKVSTQVGFLKKAGSLDGFLWSTPATKTTP